MSRIPKIKTIKRSSWVTKAKKGNKIKKKNLKYKRVKKESANAKALCKGLSGLMNNSQRQTQLLFFLSSFRDEQLERAYQRYSQRQRQRSLILVNIVDIVVKLLLSIFLVSTETRGKINKVGSYLQSTANILILTSIINRFNAFLPHKLLYSSIL